VGERINAASRLSVRRALEAGDYGFIAEEARAQMREGADAIDVQAGTGPEEAGRMRELCRLLGALDCPLVLDSARPEVLEAGADALGRPAVLNSVNGTEESLSRLIPVAKSRRWAVIALTLDENGPPKNRDDRLRIAERILDRARREGIPETDVAIDPVLLPLRYYGGALAETLAAVKAVKDRFRVVTVLGISNGSFGLKRRREANRKILALALNAGLDLGILDPADPDLISLIREDRGETGDGEQEAFRLEQECHEAYS
jgi:5-methyltetrahydrofolate--homocysteine methyltransferase